MLNIFEFQLKCAPYVLVKCKNNRFYISILKFERMLKLKIFFIALWNIWFYFLAGFGVILLFPVLLIAVSIDFEHPYLTVIKPGV